MTTARETELTLNIGTTIRCTDGDCAKLHKIALDEESDEVAALIVERGLLAKDRRVLPIDLVTKTTEEAIHVDLHSDALDDYKTYDEKIFREPAEGWEETQDLTVEGQFVRMPQGFTVQTPSVPSVRKRVHEGLSIDETPIHSGTPVHNIEGKIGSVDRLISDEESKRLTAVVLRTPGLLPEYHILSAEHISSIDEDGVYIELDEDQVQDLPVYEPES